eukprot:CAMPEP_0174319264 /NCGR_PEP_ID=MMETSP0810-20121108/8749_1 /TAXON_ID=73025 ORGANISM="Eutreptiella gymnastica-like, Strain CCMP1594" /NCGR_SAMPLE_ID=MMETSP0810 /ASSEMBLY_ACC=CAM_ASM_000659 /LENGTH=57 /DNA_ID=CAMNT_0015429749 /DNA_START=434 /DNA_END=608 /DNA_ORIENTATION=+
MDRIVDHGTVRMVRCPHEVLERDAVPEDGPVEGHVTAGSEPFSSSGDVPHAWGWGKG